MSWPPTDCLISPIVFTRFPSLNMPFSNDFKTFFQKNTTNISLLAFRLYKKNYFTSVSLITHVKRPILKSNSDKYNNISNIFSSGDCRCCVCQLQMNKMLNIKIEHRAKDRIVTFRIQVPGRLSDSHRLELFGVIRNPFHRCARWAINR